jgi:hypothetical protein
MRTLDIHLKGLRKSMCRPDPICRYEFHFVFIYVFAVIMLSNRSALAKRDQNTHQTQYVGVWVFRILLVSLLLSVASRHALLTFIASATTSDWVIIEWRLAEKTHSLKWASNKVVGGFHYVSYSQSSVFERDEVFSLQAYNIMWSHKYRTQNYLNGGSMSCPEINNFPYLEMSKLFF